MPRLACLAVAAIALPALVAGCAAPTVTVRDGTLMDLPLPPDVRALQIGTFVAKGDLAEAAAAELSSQLAMALAETGRYTLTDAADAAPADAVLTGTVEASAEDTQGTRAIRRSTGPEGFETVTVPTLRRRVTLQATLSVRRPAGKVLGEGAAEVRYDSVDDPDARGPDGLGRPDDPDRVPAAEPVVTQLAGVAARTLADMLRPVPLEATVELWPASTEAGRRGLEAARRGDYAAAAEQFARAAEARPEDPAPRFNLAVAQEASGDFAAARSSYEAVRKQALPTDREAEVDQALRRIRRTEDPGFVPAGR